MASATHTQAVLNTPANLQIVELCGIGDDGRPCVRDCNGELRAAEVAWMPWQPNWSASAGRRVVVGALEGDPARPIVLGWIDAPVLHTPADTDARELTHVLGIESGKELVLRCGKAQISLRADGRVEILGGYLLSRSTGPNKIKGASVDIN